MKAQTIDVINEATEVQNQIDSLLRAANFWQKSEAYLALEKNPYLPAIERAETLSEAEKEFWTIFYSNNETQMILCLRELSSNYSRWMVEEIDIHEGCTLCYYLSLTPDDEDWDDWDHEEMLDDFDNDRHYIIIAPNQYSLYAEPKPQMAEGEDFRL